MHFTNHLHLTSKGNESNCTKVGKELKKINLKNSVIMESNREVFKNVRGILYDNSRRSKRGLFKRCL
jgi:hypothetical protein